MSAIGKLLDQFKGVSKQALRAMGGSGQLGYGVPADAFAEGLRRKPHYIGCDMGSIDPGPAYLGSGELATAAETTKRDLKRVLLGARGADIPLLIGSAGCAGASQHLNATLALVREIAKEEGLRFRLASIRADMPRDFVKKQRAAGKITPLGGIIGELTDEEIDASSNLVGQMGTEAFVRALEKDVDVVIAGRACDTAIFAAIPSMLGFPLGPVMHMSKIIECASICCVPGGRDAIIAELEGASFVLESMNPQRRATPMSVAAHSLYEQSDPVRVAEPEGVLFVDSADYQAVDDRRCRVSGARWENARKPSVKIEGARRVGERAIMVCGSADPRFIANLDSILPQVQEVVRGLVCEPGEVPDYSLLFRRYGLDGVYPWPTPPAVNPREVFIMAEIIAPTEGRAMAVAKTTKQFLLHHGFPGRLSTGGNIAFPFTPPEISCGSAYRFNAYHVMEVDDLAPLFPIEVEEVGS
ncbi:MAG: acyclic terpene utilization AtuA family protein [Alphaproteobacteria bacterium]|nr:acyclic terpene utilization AtuA family protein [Alphaproteobacteria bacterium]